MKVPFKMPEIFPHTLGGGLENLVYMLQLFQYGVNTFFLC